MSNRPHLVSNIHDPRRPGFRDRRLLSLLSEDRLRRVLARMLDENEFLSPFGIRSLSRHHLDHPFVFGVEGHGSKSATCPPNRTRRCSAATRTGGARSGCRSTACSCGPCINYYGYYGPNFTVECPTGSGRRATLYEVAHEITERLTRIFLRR